MKLVTKPEVVFLGAGPGDPDLITLKGVKALSKADVILYDALVNKDLLNHAKPTAIKIFVGKRNGFHRYSQDEINEIIVEQALKHGNVVRLKGGDPFIFGRGAEEIDYVEAHGIGTEVVPGISSSMAVPANQGIPLTKRGVSESFWVITGTTSERKLSKDVFIAAQSSATVVILMGMNRLTDIVEIFKRFGKSETPIAIIQDGTTVREKIGFGTINSIVEIANEKKLSSPAIIVIGDVVKESNKLRSFYEDNLAYSNHEEKKVI